MEYVIVIKLLFLSAFVVLILMYVSLLFAVRRAATRIKIPIPRVWVGIITFNFIFMLISMLVIWFMQI